MFCRWLPVVTVTALLVCPAAAQDKKGRTVPKATPQGKGLKKGQALENFNRMTPQQRQKALDRLPLERRKQVEKNLERYNNLPPQQRNQLQNQYDFFRKLPPEKQQQARQVFRRINTLPEERRQVVNREIGAMRNMSGEDRKARLDSKEFKGKFDAKERRLINEMSGVFGTE